MDDPGRLARTRVSTDARTELDQALTDLDPSDQDWFCSWWDDDYGLHDRRYLALEPRSPLLSEYTVRIELGAAQLPETPNIIDRILVLVRAGLEASTADLHSLARDFTDEQLETALVLLGDQDPDEPWTPAVLFDVTAQL